MINRQKHTCSTFETSLPVVDYSRKLIPLIKNKELDLRKICCIAVSDREDLIVRGVLSWRVLNFPSAWL